MLEKVVEIPNTYTQHLLHRRHAHCSDATLAAALKAEGKKPVRCIPKGHRCAICLLSNMRRSNIPKHSQEHLRVPPCKCADCQAACAAEGKRTGAPGSSCSTDLAGPFSQPSTSAAKYAFIVTDHYTRCVWVDFITSKSAPHTARSF